MLESAFVQEKCTLNILLVAIYSQSFKWEIKLFLKVVCVYIQIQ